MPKREEEFDNQTQELPVADIKAKVEGEKIVQQYSYPVIPSSDDQEDFMISIRATNLRRWREKLAEISENAIPWAEILLALTAIIFGAIVSAIVSGIEVSSTKGIWFYIVLPPIGTASLVSQFFVRHISKSRPAKIAEELTREIPNPENTPKRG